MRRCNSARSGPTIIYYGIRRFPYALKSAVGPNGKPHNPLTFADTDPTQINTTDGAFPREPAWLFWQRRHGGSQPGRDLVYDAARNARKADHPIGIRRGQPADSPTGDRRDETRPGQSDLAGRAATLSLPRIARASAVRMNSTSGPDSRLAEWASAPGRIRPLQ